MDVERPGRSVDALRIGGVPDLVIGGASHGGGLIWAAAFALEPATATATATEPATVKDNAAAIMVSLMRVLVRISSPCGLRAGTLSQVANPRHTKIYGPGACGCGRSLADRPITPVTRPQCFDLPGVMVEVTEH
jgi:hypothetical protein